MTFTTIFIKKSKHKEKAFMKKYKFGMFSLVSVIKTGDV